MAQVPTVEQVERALLDVFQYYKSRTGDCLEEHHFRVQLTQVGFTSDDLNRGMESLVNKGFVKLKGTAFCLTDKGFAAM